MNIIKEYKTELQKYEREIFEKRREVDGHIIAALLKDNLPIKTVKAVVKTNSIVLKNKMPDFVEQYLNSFDYSNGNDTDKTKVIPYDKTYNGKKALHVKNLISFYENIDSDITSKLSSQFKMFDIGQTILRENKLSQELGISKPVDSDIIKTYVDNVMLKAREKNEILDKKQAELKLHQTKDISDKYLSYVHTYKNEQKINKFGRTDDIKIATALLLAGYSSNQIIAAINKNSEVEHLDNDYGSPIVNSCQKVLSQYKIINEATDTGNTPEAIYKKMSKDAIKSNSTGTLNMFDDIKYVKYMKKNNVDNQTIKNVLTDLSPVASDPRRQTSKYIDSLFGTITPDKTENYKNTIDAYENEINNKRAEIVKKRDLLDNALGRDRAYNDGLIAKKLLQQGHDKDSVINAISNCSPNGKQEFLPDKTDKYAYFIVASTMKNLDAEKAITSLPGIYQKNPVSLTEAKESGISYSNVYRAMINDRITKMPNTMFMLSDKTIDIDTSMQFIKKYGNEIKKEELVDTIREASPRAQLPGISADYVEKVIEESHNRLNTLEKNIIIEKEQKAENINEYKKQYEFAKGGISQGKEAQKEFLDGHAAIQMIQKGILATDIRNTIADTCENKSLEERYMYADKIIEQVKKSESRKVQIFNHYLNDDKPENVYKSHMKKLWQQKQYVSSESDIDSALYMITKGIASAEIAATIMKHSPIAIEPGHNLKDYADHYVTNKAQQEYEKEVEKQIKYTPIPSISKSDNVADEYKKHIIDYEKNCKLPINKEIDSKIVTTMLTQGYKEKEVDKALSAISPCSTGLKYGADRMRVAKENINGKSNQINSQDSVRQLNRERL